MEDTAVGIAKLEPAGIGGQCDEDGFGNALGNVPVCIFDQIKYDLTRRSSSRIDQ